MVLQPQQPADARCQQRNDDEVRDHRKDDKLRVPERGDDLRKSQPQANPGHARKQENQNREPCDVREEFSHDTSSREHHCSRDSEPEDNHGKTERDDPHAALFEFS